MSSKTIRNSIAAVVVAIISGVLFGFMVQVVVAEGEQLLQHIEMIEKEQAQQDAYRQTQRQADSSKYNREQLQSYFLLQQGEAADILNYIESIAADAKVELKTQGLVVEEGDEGGGWVRASFSYAGTKQQVIQFTQVFESLPYVSRLSEFEMSAFSSDFWQAKATIEIKMLTYEE